MVRFLRGDIHSTLDEFYADADPIAKGMLNVPFLLHLHVNHPANAALVPLLAHAVRGHMGTELGRLCWLLLKLLATSLFDPLSYRYRRLIGAGAFGSVFECTATSARASARLTVRRPLCAHAETAVAPGDTVAVKVLDVPQGILQRCVLPAIFAEVAVMERLRDDEHEHIVRLVDYGVDGSHYYIAMKRYRCTLREWRLHLAAHEREQRPAAAPTAADEAVAADAATLAEGSAAINARAARLAERLREHRRARRRARRLAERTNSGALAEGATVDAVSEHSSDEDTHSESEQDDLAAERLLAAEPDAGPKPAPDQVAQAMPDVAAASLVQLPASSAAAAGEGAPTGPGSDSCAATDSTGASAGGLRPVQSPQVYSLSEMVDFYLRVFLDVIDAVSFIHKHQVNHFDLKCANILLAPRASHPASASSPSTLPSPLGAPPNPASTTNSTTASSSAPTSPSTQVPSSLSAATTVDAFDFPNPSLYLPVLKTTTAASALGSPHPQAPPAASLPPSDSLLSPADGSTSSAPPSGPEIDEERSPPLPFVVAVGDFGESVHYTTGEGYTMQNRGTEYIKSPEMLIVANASKMTRPTYDRRKNVGANSKSDVWSLGCLLYELLTGEYLFQDEDFLHFFVRVTGDENLICPQRRALLEPAKEPRLLELLEWVLVRNPSLRPPLDSLRHRVVALLAARAAERAAAAAHK